MKTKLIFSALLVAASVVCFSAKNPTDKKIINYADGSFYGLVINADANVILTQEEKSSVKIEGTSEETAEIKSEIINGALTISGSNHQKVTIYINAPELNLIEINGAARVYATSILTSDILLLKVNGTGSIKADIRTLNVGMIVRGEGKILVSGSTGDYYQRIYGKGEVVTSGLDYFNRESETFASGKYESTEELSKLSQ